MSDANLTNPMPLTDLLGRNLDQKYSYRRAAAYISLLLPVLFVGICVLILADKGIENFSRFLLTGGALGFPVLMGVVAAIIWAGRYCIPAFQAIVRRGYAIEADAVELSFFNRSHRLADIDGYTIKNTLLGKDIILIADGQRIGAASIIFIEKSV